MAKKPAKKPARKPVCYGDIVTITTDNGSVWSGPITEPTGR